MPTKDTIFEKSVDSDTLGSRLLKSREASGISLDEVATNLGVRNSTIEAWESDRSEPRAHHLVRISGMLGVSTTWMLSGFGPAPSVGELPDEIKLIRQQLDQLIELRDQSSSVIDRIEDALGRLEMKDTD